MASRALQKLLRNQHSPKTVAVCNSRSPLPLWQIPQIITRPVDQAQSPKPNNPFGCSRNYYYPSFSFEHFLNPLVRPEPVEEMDQDEDTRTIRADSVKKKRKKKMNKHKLRKLRKRLQRKT